jgi:hypothetical protein
MYFFFFYTKFIKNHFFLKKIKQIKEKKNKGKLLHFDINISLFEKKILKIINKT